MTDKPRPVMVQVGEHREGCLAVKSVERGDWKSPWSGIPVSDASSWAYRSDGRRKGRCTSTYRVAIRCNDTKCCALLCVPFAVIEQALEDGWPVVQK